MTNQESNIENQENIYTSEDIEKNKIMAGLSYFIFFLPLIACPESGYAKFHANQALVILILGIGGNVILGIIPVIGEESMTYGAENGKGIGIILFYNADGTLSISVVKVSE